MDKDRIKGSVEQAKGSVKEAVGKATGDAKLEVEGRNEKAAGKVQNAGRRSSRRSPRGLKEIIGAARAPTSSPVHPKVAVSNCQTFGQRSRDHGYDNSSHYRRSRAFARRRRLLWTGTLVLESAFGHEIGAADAAHRRAEASNMSRASVSAGVSPRTVGAAHQRGLTTPRPRRPSLMLRLASA